MSIRDCSSTVTAYGEVWRDSFDQRHSGPDQFSVSDRVNQHCFGPADRGLILKEQQMIVKVYVLWVRITVELFPCYTALTPDRISSKWAYECHSLPFRIDRNVIAKHS